MAREVLDILVTNPRGNYVDGTAGQGEHLSLLLERLSTDALVTAVDCDPLAVAILRDKFSTEPRVRVVQGNFADLPRLVGEREVTGVFLDLGFSSAQVDGEGNVSLSFKRDEELDMRLNPAQTLTAATIVNEWSENEIASMLRENADERHARRIASRIVRDRENGAFRTTLQLRDTLVRALAGVSGKWKKDPATRTFLALRIEVNREYENLREALDGALEMMSPGGRLVVLTYHSGEDRIVKRTFRAWSSDREMLDERRGITRDVTPRTNDLTRKGLRPSSEEIESNPRARSAILRAVEKAA
jgi:16S rRNA (cytosine1402-N4)-methyltransferase